MARGLSLSLPLSALAVSAVLAGCGAGSTPATESTHTGSTPTTESTYSLTVGGTGAGTSVSHGARAPSGQSQPAARPLTTEEKREYDVNEGHCHDDGGSVRDVGTIAAYCSFPARSNDFHLIESSHEKEPAGEEE